jgi:hypothetical protein
MFAIDVPRSMDPSPFRCTVPDRRRSALLAVAGFAFAAVLLLLRDVDGWMAAVWLLVSSTAAAFGALFLIAAIAPDRFLLGVAPSVDGFELRRPLRSPRVIHFDEIQRIDAIAGGDGDRGDEISWRVHTRSGKVVLTQHMLHRSRLFDLLTAQLAIDRAALAAAGRHEPRGLELLWGRTFTIYEKRR